MSELRNEQILALSKNELERECRKLGMNTDGNINKLRLRLLGLAEDESPARENKRQKKNNLGEDLVCPITMELPWDPVTAGDGYVYERSAIEQHIKTCKDHYQPLKSPMTNQPMMTKVLLPAPHIKNTIEKLIESGSINGDITKTWMEKLEEKRNVEVILKKAEGGDVDAMYQVGKWYLSGHHTLKQNFKAAFSWFEKAHKGGNVSGTRRIGLCLCSGIGVKKSVRDGIMYLTSAAERKSAAGAFLLGEALSKGKYGLTKNKDEAIKWLNKSLYDCSKDLKEKAKKEASKMLEELQQLA
jgi:hypothetical protein